MLTKEQILAQRLQTERVTVPWIDGAERELIVRGLPMHVAERVDAMKTGEPRDAFVFVNALVDESGKRLFADEDASSVADTLSQDIILLVAHTAVRLGRVAPERLKVIKKNSTTLTDAPSGE